MHVYLCVGVRACVRVCVCVCWEAESQSRAALVLFCAAVRSSGGHSPRGSDPMADDNDKTVLICQVMGILQKSPLLLNTPRFRYCCCSHSMGGEMEAQKG